MWSSRLGILWCFAADGKDSTLLMAYRDSNHSRIDGFFFHEEERFFC
jgi:hypothetical protein